MSDDNVGTRTVLHTRRFPGESPQYREARDRLLLAERDLRRQLETVAAMRRVLPLGGEIPNDYVFEPAGLDDESAVDSVHLSQLFAPLKDNLIVYSFMWPADGSPCPVCTSFLDELDRMVIHARQRVNVAVAARPPAARVRAFAKERGWTNLRLLSSQGNTYHADYHAENPDGEMLPALNVFVRRGNRIHHFYATELLYVAPEAGQGTRHADLIWPLWNLFDLTPDGRGVDWYPRLRYD